MKWGVQKSGARWGLRVKERKKRDRRKGKRKKVGSKKQLHAEDTFGYGSTKIAQNS